MKKKIIGIFTITILIATAFLPITVTVDNCKIKNVNSWNGEIIQPPETFKNTFDGTNNGGWSSPQELARCGTGYSVATPASMAIDKNDNWHLVYPDRDETDYFNYFVKYKNETSQNAVTLASIYGNGWVGAPSITIDAKGTLHVTYQSQFVGETQESVMYIYKEAPPVPVLLVHGWQLKGGFDPDGLWKNISFRLTGDNEGSWVGDMKRYEGNGFILYTSNYTLDTTVGTHKNIRHYADNLAGEIEVMKSEENVSKVIIVAHSMGGLVSRAYIESSDFGGNLYGDDISKLIMLGTPNHGANWRLIFPLLPLIYLYFLLIGWVAERQMIPYSFFLNTLNHGNPLKIFGEDIINSNVNYYTIAGNISKSLIWRDSDGFITVKSVQLSNVPHFNYPVNHTELRTDYDVHQKVKELILQ